MCPALIAETLMNNRIQKISEGMRVKTRKKYSWRNDFYFILSACKVYASEKNNIFATVNIAKVSSYGDFYELCSFFVGNMTV